MGISRGNWADLPIELLDDTLTRLGDVEDLIRFGAVCSSWRCASLESKNTNNKSFVPWMMLTESVQEENSNKEDVRKFFNLSTKKTIELYLPEAHGRRSWGSTFGWILTVGLDLNIYLLNPLTRLQISLPPEPTFQSQRYVDPPSEPTFQCVDPTEAEAEAESEEEEEEEEEEYVGTVTHSMVEKFALSTHPNQHEGSSSSATVMIVYGRDRTLALARPGDRAWTYVQCPRKWFDDVIFFNNLFYAVQHGGDVVVVSDTTTPVPVATDIMPSPFPKTHSIRYYLVEMSGHLHMVVRRYKSVVDKTTGGAYVFTLQFRVYKLDFGQKQWIELQDLGDHAMFLGNNSSFSLHQPQLSSNCIYFTDDHSEYHELGTCDVGLFDFNRKKMVGPIYSGDCIHPTLCSVPLFFIPELQ